MNVIVDEAVSRMPRITTIARVDVPSSQIERRGNQPQDSRENECRSDRRVRGKAYDQHQRGHGEAASADAREADGQGNRRSDGEIHSSAFFENVWMPHSSFFPPQ